MSMPIYKTLPPSTILKINVVCVTINNVKNQSVDWCKVTPTYEFSVGTPKTHSAVGGWSQHHLIIVNNVQAGME